MKVTTEEKAIIRFLKKELKEAEACEKFERKKLIARLNMGLCDFTDMQEYFDAREAYWAASGTYYAYVDEIVTRIRLWVRNSK